MIRSVRRERSGAAAEVNMAPLIDMVFILLIFFLVTTTFTREAGIRVDKPRAAATESLDSKSLRVAIAASGAIYVEGTRLSLDGLKGRLRSYVRSAGGRSTPTNLVIVPDERVPAGRLVEVMDAAKQAGVRDLAVATRRTRS